MIKDKKRKVSLSEMGEKELDQSERKHFHMNFHWNA
jgi:hypothetical protein